MNRRFLFLFFCTFYHVIINGSLFSSFPEIEMPIDVNKFSKLLFMSPPFDRKALATELFKKIIGFQTPHEGLKLNPEQKDIIAFAWANGADCNPRIVHKNEIYYLIELLTAYHGLSPYAESCKSKLMCLFEKKFVSFEKSDMPLDCYPFGYVFGQSTLNLLISLGLDINQVDDQGRNFAMRMCCNVQIFKENEGKQNEKIEKGLNKTYQDLIRYFYEQGGNILAVDRKNNDILVYILKYWLDYLTPELLDFLLQRYKQADVEFFLDFKHQFLLVLTKYRGCFFDTIERDQGTQEVSQLGVNRLKAIFEVLEKHDFKITGSEVSLKLVERFNQKYSIEDLVKRAFAVERFLYYYLIDHPQLCKVNPFRNKDASDNGCRKTRKKQAKKYCLSQNNILFSLIIDKKLEEYSKTPAYQRVLTMYESTCAKDS